MKQQSFNSSSVLLNTELSLCGIYSDFNVAPRGFTVSSYKYTKIICRYAIEKMG